MWGVSGFLNSPGFEKPGFRTDIATWALATLRNVVLPQRGFDWLKQSYPPRPLSWLCGYFGIFQRIKILRVEGSKRLLNTTPYLQLSWFSYLAHTFCFWSFSSCGVKLIPV
ncbi:hypothetical protein B4U84_13080 [Westiellopsis prolifica IICB1]|nr:hypothetical protein B4U84_13080 [Westiellopsis prolifica IICB1]